MEARLFAIRSICLLHDRLNWLPAFQHYRIPVRSRSHVTSSWNCDSFPPPRCSHLDVLSRYNRNNRGGGGGENVEARFKFISESICIFSRGGGWFENYRRDEEKIIGKHCFRFGDFVSKRGRKEKNSWMESQLFEQISNIRHDVECMNWYFHRKHGWKVDPLFGAARTIFHAFGQSGFADSRGTF